MKILVVDDEKLLVKGIKFNLEQEGYQVITAFDGEEAVRLAHDESIDVILLDLMLPKIDGFTACRTIRGFSNVPIIMLTAKSEDIDKILGLEYGADDYITKPFSIRELMARVKANIRRMAMVTQVVAAQETPANLLDLGRLVIDKGAGVVRKDGADLELTQREYDLVCYFLTSAGRVVSREELMEKVWGYDYYGDLRAVDVAMRRLREKLEEDPANPKYFITKRGAGYYLQK